MNKGRSPAPVIMVLIDGLADPTARRMLGFMESLVEAGVAFRGRMKSVLPSLSRPCYASIFSGVTPMLHGITANDQTSRLETTSLFDILRQAGRTSAVAGYHWMSELFSRGAFDSVHDVEQDDNTEGVTHGRYYFLDEFPDAHLFAQAEQMRQRHSPDLLVIHPMGCDYAGHQHGSDSHQYAASAARIDFLLARLVPQWLSERCQIVVTADHGMDAQGFHGGPDDQVRLTPLYVVSPVLSLHGSQSHILEQTEMASLLCLLLGVEPAATMTPLSKEKHVYLSIQTIEGATNS